MKTRSGFFLALSLLVVSSANPAIAQSVTDLRQENARLKAELRALAAQGCSAPSTSTATWSADALTARIDAIRVGWRQDRREVHVTTTITLRNTSQLPLALNYQSRSFNLVDDRGYTYSLPMSKAVSGIPIAYESQADSTAVISAGGTRTVTFSAYRTMHKGETPGHRFDLNATFIQLEDLGQGRIRKVRDFPVAFTNAPASGSGLSLDKNTAPFPQVAEQLVGTLLDRLSR